jgi:hypothetical protein
MKPTGDGDLLVAARRALLDALEALAAHRDSVIVIGAQAIYMHTGGAAVGLAETTKDSDLALDTRSLSNVPQLESHDRSQIWARELDEGRYWCSISTMYRIARAAGQVRERRRVASHPARVRPELLARDLSEVWSWGGPGASSH